MRETPRLLRSVLPPQEFLHWPARKRPTSWDQFHQEALGCRCCPEAHEVYGQRWARDYQRAGRHLLNTRPSARDIYRWLQRGHDAACWRQLLLGRRLGRRRKIERRRQLTGRWLPLLRWQRCSRNERASSELMLMN